MLDGNFRNGVDRLVRPVGRLLVRLGVSANFLTCIGLGMSVAACLLIGSSQLQLGLIFLIPVSYTHLTLPTICSV